jgi:predicted metal-dependent peptidase
MLTEEQRVKKGHIALMKHPETALWSGVMMMGTTSVIDDDSVTAYTDGVNKRYGRKFLQTICKTQEEVNGLILHENLHIGLRHLIHNIDLFREDRKLGNMAADYVVNDMIVSLKDKTIAKLPEGGCYDPKYHNMNMREVYRLLKEEQEEKQKQGGSGSGEGEPQGEGSGYSFDEHDIDGEGSANDMTPEEAKALEARIDRAVREGALLAGRLGVELPRAVTDLLTPKVDWREALREFVTASCKGKDEYTWRKFNRRLLPNDMYLPTVEDESIGEIVVAIDTSGSIGQEQINEFATELVSICEVVTPDAIRILWWDTMVHGEQVFTDNYTNIGQMLKPLGGGGTRVACVSEYINNKKVEAEAVLVFTDGYVEQSPKWDINAPTLWLVTDNTGWQPPAGKKVIVNNNIYYGDFNGD